ncbi:bestrophin family protein [Aquimarina aquimarini]|uniref:bestrophin family protein n=1 Tax=Aquimarina aquimarini TaxID=1191734 RepID=UPI000D55CBB6|nr:bestrophin family ion channel [Aquimarina aquimarini]
MLTRKNYPLRAMLLWTRRNIYVFIILSAIPVVLYTQLHWYWLHLPWLPIGVLGTAVAFVIGFKNNASYDRLWEARKIWGGIVNTSRSFTIMVNDFITNEHAIKKLSDEELFSIRKKMILRHIAWMTSLRHALRTPKPWEVSIRNKADKEYMKRHKVRERTYTLEDELEGYVSNDEKQYILSKRNKQTACINLQSKHLRNIKEQGLIWQFSYLEIEKILVELYTLQGKCERIKNFPYPRQFATLNYIFVWIFIFLLPFGMMNEFDEIGIKIVENMNQYKPYPIGGYHYIIELIGKHFVWFTVPFSAILSWVFHTMERIGESTENPFEGNPNDVPITTMSRGIEIDIRQMIDDDENKIPEPEKERFDTQL